MYDETAKAADQPRVFSLIENSHQELEKITGKIGPVLTQPSPSLAAELPSGQRTELEARLEGLIDHIRSISSRIKL